MAGAKKPNPLPKGLWHGEVAFMLGGGPSLADVDLSSIRRRRIIAINNAYGDCVRPARSRKPNDAHTCKYEPRDWVDIVWFGDSRWFDWHRKDLARFKGLVCTCAPKYMNVRGLYVYERISDAGITRLPGKVCWNRNSGGSGISFAYHLGVRRVVLLGFDMRRVDGEPNWHKDHPSPEKNPYPKYLRFFGKIAKDAKRLGLDIVNCTPGSLVDQFPIMTLEEYLQWEQENESSAHMESGDALGETGQDIQAEG